ncbi:MAG: ArsC/Spx/MgsR family protein [Bacteroidia bacterium]
MITIYYKPNCATSIEAYRLLKKNTKDKITKIEYLTNIPTAEELKEVIKLLGMTAHEFLRKKEPLYKEKYEGKNLTEDQWIKVMIENPILIERPVIIKDGKAIIGRPTEHVVEFVKSSE